VRVPHHPDNGGSKHLWNVGLSLQDYVALHSRRHFEYSQPSKLDMSRSTSRVQLRFSLKARLLSNMSEIPFMYLRWVRNLKLPRIPSWLMKVWVTFGIDITNPHGTHCITKLKHWLHLGYVFSQSSRRSWYRCSEVFVICCRKMGNKQFGISGLVSFLCFSIMISNSRVLPLGWSYRTHHPHWNTVGYSSK
jgi:hypothetical protein